MEKLKVLLHNRPTTFTQRGGDTVVIEKLLKGLEGEAVEVTVDLEGKQDPRDFDVVHIFNFAIPDMVRFYGERARAAGKPFVVTTLLEDVPSFHYQSHFVASVLTEYVDRGQDSNWWREHRPDATKIDGCQPFNNGWTVENAAALFTNGRTESEAIMRTYGGGKVREIKLGYDIGLAGDATRFEREFGVRDFVFCVGRIESRKNQLMLLKALEHDDITVVFAGGDFSYQPDYLDAVKNFRRKGKTVFLPRLTDQQLADAYAAAKVHVLPSWYELPGLVSLEAAYYGCNVVATRNGTSSDYLGEDAFYCDPSADDSIRTAVLAAFYSPVRTSLKEKVMAHSWKETANRTLDAYREISGWKAPEVEQEKPRLIDVSLSTTEMGARFTEFLERGEIAAQEYRYDDALECFDKAAQYDPTSSRLARSRGAVELARGDHAKARVHFEAAVQRDAFDAKSLCGLGMAYVAGGEREAGYQRFIKALEIKPDHNVAILQLIECAYFFNRYDELEKALRRYLSAKPGDIEIEFCLAGCLYKMGRSADARDLNERILAKNRDHAGAKELERLLNEQAVVPLETSVEVIREQPRSDLSSISSDLSDIERELLALEEAKRVGKYGEVQARVRPLMARSDMKDSERETAQCLLAEISVLTDDSQTAEHIYGEVLARNASCARAMCGCGAIAAVRGNWNRAQELFSKALSARPEYDVALAGLGLAAAQNQQWEAAWSFYRRALKSNIENARAMLGIVEVGYALRKLPEVEEVLKEYLDLHPGDLDFMYSLAGCCFAQGKVDEAVDAINRITLFDPAHKNANELRSMIERDTRPSM